MNLSDYDYVLPEERIAQYPLEQRDQSRLMVLHRSDGHIEHRRFTDLPDYVTEGDALVINETKVFPARLIGHKAQTEGKVEALLLRRIGNGSWEALVRPGRRMPVGTRLTFGEHELIAQIVGRSPDGSRILRFEGEDIEGKLERLGQMPLPPYIRRQSTELDRERYQTVYAKREGAVAAPTAGLHFTARLLDQIQAKNVAVISILLHVGIGTFRPVTAKDPTMHRMEAEYYEINAHAADQINEIKVRGGRMIAVGTTSVRALETAAEANQMGHHLLSPQRGWTEKFIYPPYTFRVIDALVTNFHLPKSTLLMLVSAFAGVDQIRKAYAEAIREQYRFYSYGDAMLII